jgi:hypothetical protein
MVFHGCLYLFNRKSRTFLLNKKREANLSYSAVYGNNATCLDLFIAVVSAL